MLSRSCGLIVDGNHTDIVLNDYNDRIFLVISQYKKLGSLVSVSRQSAIREFHDDTYDIKVIFGRDDQDEMHAAVRFIAGQLNIDKPLLISICLKDFEVSTLRTLVKAIKKLKS